MKTTWMCLLWLCAYVQPAMTSAAEPELLQLLKYQPGMNVSGWYMSEKLDGVRAYWNGRQLLSRQGNHFAAPEWFTDKLPPFELDGELWIARGSFEQTQSITSRSTPHSGWKHVTYNIFELPNAPGSLPERLQRLTAYLDTHPVRHLRIIPQEILPDVEGLMRRLDTFTESGAEGLVLRNPDALYETGRSRNALKLKRFDDMEGRVVGYKPGKGKYRGMTGSLWVEIEGGRRLYVGSGLSDYDRRHPPAIGSTVTFRHQGFTAGGLPRFASFMRVRLSQ